MLAIDEVGRTVSIHAPAWGATDLGELDKFIGGKFQSTRPRGARLTKSTISGLGSIVSIHAPAWGATNALAKIRAAKEGFNPRARVGRDRVYRRYPVLR